MKSHILGNAHLDLYVLGLKSYRLMTKTAQKMKFSVNDFFSKCEQVRRNLRICSHLLKNSITENLNLLRTVSSKVFFLSSKVKLALKMFEILISLTKTNISMWKAFHSTVISESFDKNLSKA